MEDCPFESCWKHCPNYDRTNNCCGLLEKVEDWLFDPRNRKSHLFPKEKANKCEYIVRNHSNT